MVINCNLLMTYSTKLFVSWTYDNECSNYIQTCSQYVMKALDFKKLWII